MNRRFLSCSNVLERLRDEFISRFERTQVINIRSVHERETEGAPLVSRKRAEYHAFFEQNRIPFSK